MALFEQFFDFYVKGQLDKALDLITLNSKRKTYADLAVLDSKTRHLINFVDGALFGELYDLELQAYLLLDALEKDLNLEAPKDLFRIELTILHEFKVNRDLFEKLFRVLPKELDQLKNFFIALNHHWQTFKEAKKSVAQLLPFPFDEIRPWYPLRYDFDFLNLDFSTNEQELPIIFFEPLKNESLLEDKLKNKPLLLIFQTYSHFFQALSQKVMLEYLIDPNHLIYILQDSPEKQFNAQNKELFKNKKLVPFYINQTSIYQNYEAQFLKLLETFLNGKENLSVGEDLHLIASKMVFLHQQERLGIHYAPALQVYYAQRNWHTAYQNLLKKKEDSFFKDDMHDFLNHLSKSDKKIKRSKNEKLTLVHVVPQIVDGGHAPSRILENIITNHDTTKFDFSVISSEVWQENFFEYPYNNYISQPSKDRAPHLLKKIEDSGVKVMMSGENSNYKTKAENIAKTLNQSNVDIVIFHGVDVVNLMTAQMSAAPLKVFFEHGTQLNYKGFDLAILSTHSALDVYKDLYDRLGTKKVALPFAINPKSRWPTDFPSLMFSPEIRVMTTISTKLDTRVSDQMLNVIAKILQKVPYACYAPIGAINQKERFYNCFRTYGVEKQYIPIGHSLHPSFVARHMHLYLNEFPVGSCLGMLDAMASGIPVVSMFDLNGPQQSRYGGEFMGQDYVIKTNDPNDYVELAVKLLTDNTFYKEWAEHTKKRYGLFSDVKAYVSSLEEFLLAQYWG